MVLLSSQSRRYQLKDSNKGTFQPSNCISRQEEEEETEISESPPARSVAAAEDQAAEAAAGEDPAIERYYSTIGSRLVAGGMSINTKAENLAQLNLAMRDRGDTDAEAGLAHELERLRCRHGHHHAGEGAAWRLVAQQDPPLTVGPPLEALFPGLVRAATVRNAAR